MGCTTCRTKECRSSAKDCFDVKELSLATYGDPEVRATALSASRLIDNGRAGTLNRLQEILEYAADRGYRKIGVAYCFGMPDLARSLEAELKKGGFVPLMVQCTAGGVREREIDETKTKDTVSCNPAGQAHTLMDKGAEFVIEMGLCMGHDVIFHRTLKLPFTTLLVKDRIYSHNPAMALESYSPPDAKFLEEMDNSFRMRTPDWVIEQQREGDDLLVIDVRDAKDYETSHIAGAINLPLKELPARIHELEERRHHTLILYCTGAVRAGYGAMFLFGRGFKNVYLLSGGIGRWEKEGKTLESKTD